MQGAGLSATSLTMGIVNNMPLLHRHIYVSRWYKPRAAKFTVPVTIEGRQDVSIYKGLFAVAGMSLFVSGNALGNDLTVVSWGGAYTKSQVEATAARMLRLVKHYI